ncbi:hypothetical protein ANCDUO_09896 [Ancylostoma duodenale]|uniref:Uncharacterized protein n=1 Tax=Ancylostoma duodenale TaxID=51022 RepID=A0A0C2DBT7_9BILA|nr:hypothetical protein ANCDUO_09896 [Ancylostoma duodenale]
MNYCYEEIVYHQDCYSFHVDADMRQFLLDKEKKDMASPWNRLVEKAEKPQPKSTEHKTDEARKATSDTKSDETTKRKAQPSDKSDDDRKKSDEDLKKKSADSSLDKSDDSKEDRMKKGLRIEAKKKELSCEGERGRKKSEVRRAQTDITDKRKSSIRQRSRSDKKKEMDSRSVNSLERAPSLSGQIRKSKLDEKTSSGEKSRSSEATRTTGSSEFFF